MSKTIELIATRPLSESKGVLSAIVKAAGGKLMEVVSHDSKTEANHFSVPTHMQEIATSQAEQNGYKVHSHP